MSKAPKKPDYTELLLALDGDRGAGKSAIVDLILLPALGALGGVMTSRTANEKDLREIVTFNVPVGSLKKLAEAPRARVGFQNFDKVLQLCAQRATLAAYSEQDMAGTVARMALPAALKDSLQPDALITLLKTDARAAIAAIESQLEALGFDTAYPLPI